MKAADVMVSTVITVSPDSTVIEIAELLIAHRINAVPVVRNDRELVGIVSAGDLIRGSEIGSESQPGGWLALLTGAVGLPRELPKLRARTASEVMTRDVVVAAPATPLRDIAVLLEQNAINRVPIVDHGKLVGIISRANLVQALATARKEVKAATATSDRMIREDLMARLGTKAWAKGSRTNIVVHDGVVELWGVVHSEAEKDAIRIAAEDTPGARAVTDNLAIRPVPSPSAHLDRGLTAAGIHPHGSPAR